MSRKRKSQIDWEVLEKRLIELANLSEQMMGLLVTAALSVVHKDHDKAANLSIGAAQRAKYIYEALGGDEVEAAIGASQTGSPDSQPVDSTEAGEGTEPAVQHTDKSQERP